MSARPPLTPNAWLRYGLICRALSGIPAAAPMLEIGAGQGALGSRLAARFRYLGVEMDPTSAQIARPRVEASGGRLLTGDALELTEGSTFRVVCAFEVLEHLEDDRSALLQWRTRLEPGGRLVVSVPGGPHRMGPWDEAVGHYRRYSRRSLAELLETTGFQDVRVSAYGFPIGYALEAVRNRAASRLSADEASFVERTAASGRRFQPSQTGWLTAVATWPFRVLQRPFAATDLGTGLVATAVIPLDG